ncbi:hypothetical protein BUE93_09515 [Chromobacterium amazonense]|uniref:Uncharacterized protein n=1 Tax=Chromobacterium amazonense TaxID=1382803 RepID=A0A2S9X584_9NEIS|nr:hypothetical protein [Chromobacterium amazonense]PRP70888.1 hypothetical protein BUE93_09515 [Chromobacterium amazonense]
MILSDGTTAVTLDDDMIELQPYWQPVDQAISYTLTGAMLVDESVKQAGRPMTFQSQPDAGWVPRTAVEQLHKWASQPGIRLKLTRHGQDYPVTFNRQDGQAVEARPVLELAVLPRPNDAMLLTVRLISV